MGPLFFGSRHHLFGFLHAPDAVHERRAAVVMCYPFGQDSLYALRTFRVLSARLAAHGFKVLRFDYSGTGDSAGELSDASIEQWIEDIGEAIALARSDGTARVSIVGRGLGAGLAALAATRTRSVEKLVMWEPVLDGQSYLEALTARHRSWMAEVAREIPNARELESAEDLLGLRLDAAWREQLQGFDAAALPQAPAADVCIVWTGSDAGVSSHADRLRRLGARVALNHISDEDLPSVVPGLNLGIVQSRVVAEVGQWLESDAHV